MLLRLRIERTAGRARRLDFTVTVNGQPYTVRGTLDRIEAQLDPMSFLRISRSVLVNKSAVTAVEGGLYGEYTVELKDDREFVSGRSFRKDIQAMLLRKR